MTLVGVEVVEVCVTGPLGGWTTGPEGNCDVDGCLSWSCPIRVDDDVFLALDGARYTMLGMFAIIEMLLRPCGGGHQALMSRSR